MVFVLMQTDGFKCIAKEADLTLELLRHGACPSEDYLIDQGINIRLCALSYMDYTLSNSVAASAAMLVHACVQKPT